METPPPTNPVDLPAARPEPPPRPPQPAPAEDALRRRVAELEERGQQAQAAMARYRELFGFAPDCYLVTDLSATILQANHAAGLLFDRPKSFLIDKPLAFLLAAEDRPNFFRRLGSLRSEPEAVSAWEVRLRLHRGEARIAALTVTVVADAQGRPTELRWLLRDVTDQKRVEHELRAARAFAEGLIDAAQAVVLVVTQEGEILRANAYLAALSGYRPDELAGQNWADLLLPEGPPAHLEFRNTLEWAREGPVLLGPLRTRDGRVRTLAWSCRRLMDIRPGYPAILLVGHDVTGLLEAQQRALDLERLAAIGQMAAGLAHESRNALQRGVACLERLGWALHGQPVALDLLARARRAQDDLLRLYEQVREYAAPIRLECRPCDLGAVWRETWAHLIAVAGGRDARLEEDLGTADLSCGADAFRLGQVFRNLFDNALAACPDPVRVRVRCGDAEVAGGPGLRVTVEDNGPGLDEEQRRRLFEPFYTTKTRGTGLGLAIARRIVEAHGGQIAAADRSPPGAEIVFTLPRSQP
jgi:PAS domain S-box-containing protein